MTTRTQFLHTAALAVVAAFALALPVRGFAQTSPTSMPITVPADAIRIISGSFEAPCVIQADAIDPAIIGFDTNNEGSHRITDCPLEQWSFGDPTGQHNEDLLGWSAGHLYENGGVYPIELQATYPTWPRTKKTFSRKIAIGADKRVKHYVDANTGDDANPGTITAPWKTLFMASKWTRGECYIILADDETFPITGVTFLGTNLIIQRSGTGQNKPIIVYTGGLNSSNALNFSKTVNCIVRGVVVTSIYANHTSAGGMDYAVDIAGGKNFAFIDSEIYNSGYGIKAEQGDDGIFISGYKALNEAAYSIWMNGSHWMIVESDCRVSYQEHTVRGVGKFVNITNCNFENIPNGTGSGGAKAALALQGERYTYVHNLTWGVNCDQSIPIINRGGCGQGPLNAADNAGLVDAWCVWEECHAMGGFSIAVGCQHVLIRDCDFTIPTKPGIVIVERQGIPSDAKHNNAGKWRINDDIVVANCTVHNPATASDKWNTRNGSFASVGKNTTRIGFYGNLFDAPFVLSKVYNAGSLQISCAPTELESSGNQWAVNAPMYLEPTVPDWTPIFPGGWPNKKQWQTRYADFFNNGPAVVGSTPDCSFRDLNGKTRHEESSVGAVDNYVPPLEVTGPTTRADGRFEYRNITTQPSDFILSPSGDVRVEPATTGSTQP